MMNADLTADPQTLSKPRRGRPPRSEREFIDTREALIRSGLEVITEMGYLSAGIDAVIKSIAVPKGSFYHYFKSKQDLGMTVLDAYGNFFAHRLDKFLLDVTMSPLSRIDAFVRHAGQGMAKFSFTRGCLVGNLLQESALLPEDFPEKLKAILGDWESRIAACLREAQQSGEISATLLTQASPEQLAQIFWSGWEGAVMRAKLFRSAEPLDQFWAYFRRSLRS